MFGDPVRNEKGWPIMRLDQVCTKITDGTHHSPDLLNEGIPYVTAKHVKPSGLNFDSSPSFISKEDHIPIFKRCNPQKGDVLYIKDGATTGIAAINTFDEEISLLSSLALLKPNYSIITNHYLCFWLNNDAVKSRLNKIFMAGAAIKRFTLQKIVEFEIPVPDLSTQRKFSLLISNIEEQKKLALKSLQKSEDLFQSLLQRAFRGELG